MVQSADRSWLIATSSDREGEDRRAYRYPLSDTVSDQFLVDYGLPQRASAISVPPEWLALFPEGGEIGPGGFHLPRFGQPAKVPGGRGQGRRLPPARGRPRRPGGRRRLPAAGPLRPGDPGADRRPDPGRGRGPDDYEKSTFLTSHWPETALEPLNSQPCAELDVANGQVPRVWLAGDPQGDAESPEPGATGAIALGERRVVFDRGHGAFVQDATWDTTTSSSRVVVDALGKAFPLTGGPITLDNLGYDPDSAPGVPDEWVSLFDEGVALSTYAALCAPADRPGEQQSTDDCAGLPQ